MGTMARQSAGANERWGRATYQFANLNADVLDPKLVKVDVTAMDCSICKSHLLYRCRHSKLRSTPAHLVRHAAMSLYQP